jgi:hypothetical protein
VLIRKRDVRLRERRIGPYKYPAVDRARGEERQKKKAGERPKEKGSRKQGNKKKPKEKRTHNKKTQEQGKE